MRVLYINVHNVDYPRNRLIRDHLVNRDATVDVVGRSDSRFFMISAMLLIWKSVFRRASFDVVILSELGVQYALFAKLVAIRFRAPLVVDNFVGMYETNVGDWAEVGLSSIRARVYKVTDAIAMRIADLVLIDTEVRASELRKRGATAVFSVPVGAPRWASSVPGPKHSGQLRVLFYGNYAPLHGVPYILDGIAESTELCESVRMVGDGTLRSEIESHASLLGLDSLVSFSDSVKESELVDLISQCDVVLGVFGMSNKAKGVIANKVWQGLACGKTVVTRDSAALDEIAKFTNGSLITVDMSQGTGAFAAALQQAWQRKQEACSTKTDVAEKLQGYVTERLNELSCDLAELVKGRSIAIRSDTLVRSDY